MAFKLQSVVRTLPADVIGSLVRNSKISGPVRDHLLRTGSDYYIFFSQLGSSIGSGTDPSGKAVSLF